MSSGGSGLASTGGTAAAGAVSTLAFYAGHLFLAGGAPFAPSNAGLWITVLVGTGIATYLTVEAGIRGHSGGGMAALGTVAVVAVYLLHRALALSTLVAESGVVITLALSVFLSIALPLGTRESDAPGDVSPGSAD